MMDDFACAVFGAKRRRTGEVAGNALESAMERCKCGPGYQCHQPACNRCNAELREAIKISNR